MATSAAKIPHAHNQPPFAVLMGDVMADIPVLATKEAAFDFARRGAQETAGNVEFTVVSLPLLLKRNDGYPKLVEALRELLLASRTGDITCETAEAAAEALLRELGEAS